MGMNWNVVERNWPLYAGTVKIQWDQLTDDHLDAIAGKRENLSGKIQETYGIDGDEAEKQIQAFEGLYKV
jgi:uncharacterized protein YjbJ (UPF0337 family)